MPLTPEQLKSFEENGYLVVENVVTGTTLQRIRDAISEMVEEATTKGTDRAKNFQAEDGDVGTAGTAVARKPLRKLNELVCVDDFFKSVAASPHILDMVAQLTGGAKKIMLYSDHVFLKPALCGSEKRCTRTILISASCPTAQPSRAGWRWMTRPLRTAA